MCVYIVLPLLVAGSTFNHCLKTVAKLSFVLLFHCSFTVGDCSGLENISVFNTLLILNFRDHVSSSKQ